MNFSEQKSERVALSNLSNSSPNFLAGNNPKPQSNSFLPSKNKKVHVENPFPSKSSNKFRLATIANNDPENSQYFPELFTNSNKDTCNDFIETPNLSQTSLREKQSVLRPKTSVVKKARNISSIENLPIFGDSLNKKRRLDIEENVEFPEFKFGESYQINEAMFIEDDYEKNLQEKLNNISFADTFQTFQNENEGEKISEDETGEIVNIYADFQLDFSFADGKNLYFLNINFLQRLSLKIERIKSLSKKSINFYKTI